MLEFFLSFSLHALPGDWNSIHPGARYIHENVSVGAYLNSENSPSLYASYDFGNIEIGAATGYEAATLLPFVRFTYDIENFTVFAVPAMTAKKEAGIVFGVEIKWGSK